MANQLKMALVQDIQTLHDHGWSARRIARELGVHRETVGRYVARSQGLPLASKPASAPTGSGGSELTGSAPTGSPADNSKPAKAPIGSPSLAAPWRQVIADKLEVGLTAQRIYQDLVADHGYVGSYYSIRRLIKKLTAGTPMPYRRMESEPGAEAQVDFGRGAPIVTADGKRRSTWVFRIVLSHSRKGYSEAVSRQDGLKGT